MYNEMAWISKTVGSFLDFTLGMWNTRCNALHGADAAEVKMKKKEKLSKRVKQCYDDEDTVDPQFQHLYSETYKEMCKRTGQYLGKWLETVNLVGTHMGSSLKGTD